nr:OmpA family protein [Natronocella acetinitrilica]
MRAHHEALAERLATRLDGEAAPRQLGDRIILQSDALFGAASATLAPGARERLDHVAEALSETIAEIPEAANWLVEVAGHTDARPIATERFPSNWELSGARALAVTTYLVEQGVAGTHLAAVGRAEFEPLEEGRGAAAYQANRRIELRLVAR